MHAFRSVRALSSMGLSSMKVGRIHQRRITSLALPAMQTILVKRIIYPDITKDPVNKYDLNSTCGILSMSMASQFSTAAEYVSEDDSNVINDIDNSITDEHKWPSPVSTTQHINKSRNSVFVGGYNFNHDKNVLKEIFTQFGEVYDVFVPLKQVYAESPSNNNSYRFAFVYFTHNKAVQRALKQENIELKTGQIIEIKERQQSKKSQQNEKTFVVYNIPDNVTPNVVIDTFGTFGELELANFVFNSKEASSKEPENSNSFAFIVYKNPPRNEEILNSHLTIDSHKLIVKKINKKARTQPRNRFLKVLAENLPRDLTDDSIKEHFNRYGSVEYVKILETDQSNSSSAAVIQYSNYEEALHASENLIQEFEGINVTVRSLGWKEV